MHAFAFRHIGLLTGLITSAALAGCQAVSLLGPATSPHLSSDVDGGHASAFLDTFQPSELGGPSAEAASIWTAPPLAEYPFERVPTPMEASAGTREPRQAPGQDTGTLADVGIASTYGEGDDFQGRPTACGQRFDTNVPQVAHKTLPCGTMVRVEDTTSGKSVVVQVTDRGPYVKGRVVDLSWAAFSQLHPRTPDLLSVKVYLVDTRA